MAVEVGQILEGKVTGITNFGAFIEFPDKTRGMVHISEVSNSFIKDIHEKLTDGQVVSVKVIDIGENGKIALSIKKALPPEESSFDRPKKDRPKKGGRPQVWTGQKKTEPESMSFEDMMAKFKSDSDEKMSDLKKNSASKRGASVPRRGSNNPRG